MDSDDACLAELKELKIDIRDTTLGRHRATMKRQRFALVSTMSAEELEALRLEMETHNQACAPKDNVDPPPGQQSRRVRRCWRGGEWNQQWAKCL